MNSYDYPVENYSQYSEDELQAIALTYLVEVEDLLSVNTEIQKNKNE